MPQYTPPPHLAPLHKLNSNQVHCLWSGCYMSFNTELEAYNHGCEVHILDVLHNPICLWQPSRHNTTSPCGFKYSHIHSSSHKSAESPSSTSPLAKSSAAISESAASKGTFKRFKDHLLIHFSRSLLTIPCPAKNCSLLFRNAKSLRRHCINTHKIQYASEIDPGSMHDENSPSSVSSDISRSAISTSPLEKPSAVFSVFLFCILAFLV